MSISTTDAWQHELTSLLTDRFGDEQAQELIDSYADAFPAAYRDAFSPSQAVTDVPMLEGLQPGMIPLLSLVPSESTGARVALLWSIRPSVLLADVFPVLENLGMRIADHQPFEVHPAGRRPVRVEKFDLLPRDSATLSDPDVRRLVEDTFTAVWNGATEDDRFNQLVLRAGIHWRDVALLRGIYAYLRQAGNRFSQSYVERTLLAHRDVARLIVACFRTRFDPESAGTTRAAQTRFEVETALHTVENLNEDRVLRAALTFIEATVRTNYFQRGPDDEPKPYLACKLDPAKLPFLPPPRPAAETFVYSPRVEGLHLRARRVARGGIRWSDRPEDYRTEALALMKAQMVKNAVIVPHGAKGAFVIKRAPPPTDQSALDAEVRACYATFIRGLLDLTDNRVQGQLRFPADTTCHDDADPYLVVAADKGTASFSDLANDIAGEYGYWLGDAFAAGGSTGYQHKALGITARGAWESVRRHFGELGLDPDRDEFTAVGIGDMSGDVFGNAMRRPTIKLLAAFDHRHIFLDPDPEPAAASVERSRLAALPGSSWADYDSALISPGGGVFPRTAKSIPLTSQARAALGTAVERVTADELIRLVLRAPVDLLYHGGVGTYVKSAEESHTDVSDIAHDLARVDAADLRARIVAEGGNLGLTQRARIEFAQAGGKINTDFIDNSAGVNISDREVNIKILLDAAVAEGRLDRAGRNRLLGEVVDEVTAQVLADNYHQAQSISVTEALGARMLDRIQQEIHSGEIRGRLDRGLEFLPSDEVLDERQETGVGLARPEIAVMLAYSKNLGHDLIMDTPLPEDPYLESTLAQYLPPTLRAQLADVLPRHPMRHELVATALTNELHNRAGSGILLHLQQLTADTTNHISATVVARDVLGLPDIWDDVDALDLPQHANSQVRLLIECRRALERAALWFLRTRQRIDMAAEVARFAPTLRVLGPRVRSLLSSRARATVDGRIAWIAANGVPESLCERVFILHSLCSGMDIAEIAWHNHHDLDWTADVYFTLVEALDLDWLGLRMPERHSESHWTTLAKASLRDDLLTQTRRLAAAAVHNTTGHVPAHQAVESWLALNADRIQLYWQTYASLKETPTPDLSMLSVALQELRNLAQVTEPLTAGS